MERFAWEKVGRPLPQDPAQFVLEEAVPELEPAGFAVSPAMAPTAPFLSAAPVMPPAEPVPPAAPEVAPAESVFPAAPEAIRLSKEFRSVGQQKTIE